MARIVVTAQLPTEHDAPVLLDESVQPVHLSSEHSARQPLERLSRALTDAAALESADHEPASAPA